METPDFETSPRGLKIKEKLNVMLELKNPASNLFRCEDKSLTLQTGYLKKELCLYLGGINSASMFSKASKFWDKIKNEDSTVNSAYGYLIFRLMNNHGFTQFDWVVKSLLADKDSRQAIMHFNRPEHQFSDVRDFPCTLTATFHIRDDKLYMTTVMRSNDIRKGLQYDLPFFTLLQRLVWLKLKAKWTDLEMGTYSHLSQSLHVYESDFEYAEKIIASDIKAAEMPKVENANIIMSDDIDKLTSIKFSSQDTLFDFFIEENRPFYNWICS
jgi:thymidylate synthase